MANKSPIISVIRPKAAQIRAMVPKALRKDKTSVKTVWMRLITNRWGSKAIPIQMIV